MCSIVLINSNPDIPGTKKDHWVVIFVSIQEGVIATIDPLHENYKLQEKVLDNANKFFKLFNKDIVFTKIQKFRINRQEDKFSCGVFCCFYMKRLIEAVTNNNSIENVRLQLFVKPLMYRQVIKNTLINTNFS